MVGQDSCADENLEEAKRADPKFTSEDRKKVIKHFGWIFQFSHDKDSGLKDDKQPVEYSKEGPPGLVWDGASQGIIVANLNHGIVQTLPDRNYVPVTRVHKVIPCSYVLYHSEDTARENEQ